MYEFHVHFVTWRVEGNFAGLEIEMPSVPTTQGHSMQMYFRISIAFTRKE